MAARRPLVLIAGTPRECPTADTVMAGPSMVHFTQADGTVVWLPLTTLDEPLPAVPVQSTTTSYFMAGW